MYGIVGILLIM